MTPTNTGNALQKIARINDATESLTVVMPTMDEELNVGPMLFHLTKALIQMQEENLLTNKLDLCANVSALNCSICDNSPRDLSISDLTGPHPHTIIIVDDSKNSNTKDAAEKYIKEVHQTLKTSNTLLPHIAFYSREIKSLRENEKGLGGAYKFALQKVSTSLCAIIDCDLSHDPYDLVRLVRAYTEQSSSAYKIKGLGTKATNISPRAIIGAAGSRYINSSGVVRWSRGRVFVSSVANWVAKFLLNLRITDCTSSMRIYETDVLKKTISYCKTNGFAIQMELATRIERNKKYFTEIPIVFEDRLLGDSKFSLKEIIKFLTTVGSLSL